MSRLVAKAIVLLVMLALPVSSHATAAMSVTPSVFAPNSTSKALVCLVASDANLALNNNDTYQAQFDFSSVTALSSDDVVHMMGYASGFTAYHSGSIGLVGLASDGTDMPGSSEACVIVTITTGPEGAGLVQFSTNNAAAIPVPSAQPIALFPLPVGPQGPPGANGSNGADGAPGQSVIGTDEPAGSNCTAGGVRYEAASGVNYVCNGLDGTMGSPGAEGPQGAAGPQGELGPKGGGCAVGDSQGWMPVLVVGAIIIAIRRRRTNGETLARA